MKKVRMTGQGSHVSSKARQSVTEAEMEGELLKKLLKWQRRLLTKIHWSRKKIKRRSAQNGTTGRGDTQTDDLPENGQEYKCSGQIRSVKGPCKRRTNIFGRRAEWEKSKATLCHERGLDGKPSCEELSLREHCMLSGSEEYVMDLGTPRKPHVEVDEDALTIDTDANAVSVDLAYEFSPRLTSPGEFILHATYTFTSPTISSQLLAEIQALKFDFCPHITTESKTRRGQLHRSLFSEIRPMLIYQDCCEFCWTDFRVEVQYPVVGVGPANKVIFCFWHSLSNGDEDVIWHAVKDIDMYGRAAFARSGIRRRWENAVPKKWYET